MYSFLISLILLVVGYFVYGKYVAKVFGPDEKRQTPCYTKSDGIDFMPMPTWKIFMIQFLNIAGVGPIFGAIMGSQFGTASYLWIVLGTIFAGATHDYIAAMVSLRQDGASLPELIGRYLGNTTRIVMSVFVAILLILVGAVFTSSPANILGGMTDGVFPEDNYFLNHYFWILVIFVYYIIATLCPVDKIIGKIYPFFAFCLIFMALGLVGYILIVHPALPEWWDAGSFINEKWMGEAKLTSVFPMMFISIACGAISGFHATQSPMMARCLTNEKLGRPCFYGAMVTEGIVALVWAAAATCFFGENGLMNPATGKGFDGGTVASMISTQWLGTFGGILALLGVAFAPISTGDTALRSARLIIADFLKLEQKQIAKRLLISIPLFIVTAAILIWSMSDANGFGKLWRYFGWSNQTLSVFTLWAMSVYLMRHGRNYWITFLPAMFMTVVTTSFILMLKQGGFGLSPTISLVIGLCVSFFLAGIFINKAKEVYKDRVRHDK